MLKAVLFDLDGTLLDTAPDFIFCLNTLLAEEKKQVLSDTLIRNTVSNGATSLTHLGFPHTLEDEAELHRLRQRLLDLYSAHLADHSTLFDGIWELLEFIKQTKLAWGIVTNKPFLYTEPLLKKIAFPLQPTSIVCPDHVIKRKPDPEPILLACKQLGCTINEAIYFGDHRRDIEAGLNAGMHTIACAYGYIDDSENPHDWNAQHLIQHPLDAIPLLKKYL